MNILDSDSEWDQTQPWMDLEERNNAVDALFANPAINTAGLLRRMADDIELCFRLLFTTHDPRGRRGLIPFRLWAHKVEEIKGALSQVDLAGELFKAIDEQYPLLVDKSRDVGVTWIALGVYMHCWLFWDDFHALVTSRKEELIDSKREPDTLFERCRMIVRNMPSKVRELLLPGWKEATYATFARLVNPANRNTITGEAPIADFGRQGRYTMIHYDEGASITELTGMLAAAGDSSRCHVYVSTPKGKGNEFYRIKRRGQIKRVFFHWTSHPTKSKGFYEVQA